MLKHRLSDLLYIKPLRDGPRMRQGLTLRIIIPKLHAGNHAGKDTGAWRVAAKEWNTSGMKHT